MKDSTLLNWGTCGVFQLQGGSTGGQSLRVGLETHWIRQQDPVTNQGLRCLKKMCFNVLPLLTNVYSII